MLKTILISTFKLTFISINRHYINNDDLAFVALFWKLEGLGGDFKPRHNVHTVSVSPDLEVEAQSH